MLGKCVFVCVYVEGGGLWIVGQQGAGKPHPYGGAAPQSPIFRMLLPPTPTPNTSPPPTHTADA